MKSFNIYEKPEIEIDVFVEMDILNKSQEPFNPDIETPIIYS